MEASVLLVRTRSVALLGFLWKLLDRVLQRKNGLHRCAALHLVRLMMSGPPFLILFERNLGDCLPSHFSDGFYIVRSWEFPTNLSYRGLFVWKSVLGSSSVRIFDEMIQAVRRWRRPKRHASKLITTVPLKGSAKGPLMFWTWGWSVPKRISYILVSVLAGDVQPYSRYLKARNVKAGIIRNCFCSARQQAHSDWSASEEDLYDRTASFLTILQEIKWVHELLVFDLSEFNLFFWIPGQRLLHWREKMMQGF